jgi:hypothetical protein
MSSYQPSLFDQPASRPDPVRDGPCATCTATRPAGYARNLFLEPVSLECGDCNGRTLREIMHPRSRAERAAAIERHHRGMNARKRKRVTP